MEVIQIDDQKVGKHVVRQMLHYLRGTARNPVEPVVPAFA